MGTYGTVVIVTDDSSRALPVARRGHAVFARVDSLMSNWTSTSEVARLNRVASREAAVVHPEVAVVLDSALAMWRRSDGAFDITVEPLVRLWGFLGGTRRVPSDAEIEATLPKVGAERVRFDAATRTLRFDRADMKIDLGGIAKGYAVDVAAETLAAQGIADGLVNISGNMRALGSPAGASSWRIGIRDPRDRMPYFARIQLPRDRGVSTSGQYEQFLADNGKTYGHIIDPRTGRPSDGLISVTVIAPTALDADTWDTPLFVLGRAAAAMKAKERDDIAVVLVTPGSRGVDTVWVESAIASRFALEPAARALFVVKSF
jgi:thiamine biosynthesis lipoprotein